MKKIIFLISFFVVLVFFLLNQEKIITTTYGLIYYSPCDTPLSYRIDTVDPKFNLEKEEFTRYAQQASDIWNNAYGKNLFILKNDGQISINLIYDQRQFLNNQISQLDSELNNEKNIIEPKIEEYKKRVSDFNSRISSLNKEIEYWNSQGGAPPSEFDRIINEQLALQNEANELNQISNLLNQSKDQYNSKISELNETIGTYNQALKYRPEEGIYIENGDEKRIVIYFNVTKDELVHTLAHEMGHALHLDHINDPNSIMFHKTTEVISLSSEDYEALEYACRKQNIVERAGIQIRNLASKIKFDNFTQ